MPCLPETPDTLQNRVLHPTPGYVFHLLPVLYTTVRTGQSN